MAPRATSSARRRGGTAIDVPEPSSSSLQPSTSKATMDPLAELNLLQHVNGIRQVPNFTAFDIFTQSTGIDWMDGILAQAKVIRKQWETEFIASSREQRGTQAARMAGEMLKSPSRKRAVNARIVGRATSRKVPKETSTTLQASENKENASTSAVIVKPGVSTDLVATVTSDASEHGTGAARGTRSRADKSQIAKLPNPFQAKVLQTKPKVAKGSAVTAAPDRPVAEKEQIEDEPGQVAAEPQNMPEPNAQAKDTQKAPVKLTKKQQTELKKKEAAAATAADEEKGGPSEIPPPTLSDQPQTTKGRGKAKQHTAAEVGPSSEGVPARVIRSPERQIDESMQVDATFAGDLLTDLPQASTPTGKKASSKLLEKMLAEEGIAPIADEDEESIASSTGFDDMDPITEGVTKTIETTLSVRNDQTVSAASASTSETHSGNAPSLNANAPPPKQKRTLASFGGSKKSLAYGNQLQASSTPANAGFKSSFLNKSLRKALKTGSSGGDGVEDDNDDEDDEDNSMIGTKANTQANAAAMLGVKVDGRAASRTDTREVQEEPRISDEPVPSFIPAHTAGLKRKSDEMDGADIDAPPAQAVRRASPPKLARTLSGHSDKDVAPSSASSRTANSTSASKTQTSKLPTTSNLLRTKLESARLQKSTNTGVVGLGAKGLSSPILGRAIQSSAVGMTETTSTTTSVASAPAAGPRSSGPTVASLRGQWEAKTQSTRASSKKLIPSPPKAAAPSKIPAPTSTTPLNSPAKPLRQAASQVAANDACASVRPAAKPASAPSLEQRTSCIANEDKAVEAELGMASTSLHQTDTNVSELMASSFAHDDSTSTLNEEEEDADDESEIKGDDGKTVTKVVRPLSAAAQTTQNQCRAKGSDGTTTTQRTKSGSYFSGKDESADSDADDDELTLEELEGKRSSASASAASTAVIKSASVNPAIVNGSKQAEGAPGVSQWGHKLKSLFNINGAPPVPPPAPAFQPKTSRTLSTSVSTQKDVVPREVQAAPALATSALGGGSNKTSSVLRADQLDRKEADDVERKLKEQEEKRKQIMASKVAMTKTKADEEREKERKKRMREEEERSVRKAANAPLQAIRPAGQAGPIGSSIGQPPKARLVGQLGGAAASGVPAPSAKLKSSTAPTGVTSGSNGGGAKDDGGKKRRLSKERDEGTNTRPIPSFVSKVTAKGLTGTSSIRPLGTSVGTASGPPRQIKPATNNSVRPQQQSQSQQSSVSRPPMANQGSNFSQQNPFQQPQRPTGGAGMSQQTSRPMTAPGLQPQRAQQQPQQVVPPSPVACVDDNDVSLPSIVSEYSDSEDEATQARRARAAPWTKGDALHRALQEQQAVDADLIFGIPQGSVDLETLMPAESASAKARLGRPRTSSANWSGADGLKQWEIDRYNERMNIVGPGYRLAPAGNKVVTNGGTGGGVGGGGGGGVGSANGRLGPNGQDHRRSVLAIGAAAQHRAQQQSQQHPSHRP